MRKLLALLVVLAVSGCSADAAAPKTQQPDKRTTPASTPAPAVSAAAPTVPYLLKGRLHAGGQVLPGRYGSLIVRGRTWLGWERWDRPWAWGTGATAHPLAARTVAKLSPSGRYLATVTGGHHCEGGPNPAGKPCTVGLVDTSGAERDRRLRVGRTVVLAGVTDGGVVVLTEGADLRWNELMWDAAGDADGVVAIEDSPEMRAWAMHDWGPGSFGNAGLEFFAPNVSQRWLGVLVDGQVRARFRIPQDVELGPGGAWVVRNPWVRYQRDLKGALESTTPTLMAHTLGKHGRLGAPVPLQAPAGWFFARATPGDDAVFWEDADTFVARMVDSRQSGDRLARCDLPLATCVLVES
jgi:hypothetical protein